MTAIRTILLVGILSMCAFAADARHPPIERAKKSSGPQSSSAQATPDRRGTKDLPVVVKLLNTGKSDKEAAEETAHVKNEDNAEWWTIVLAGAAVVVGCLQLVVFVAQAYVLVWTVRETRRSSAEQGRAFMSAEGITQFFEREPISGLYNWRFRPQWRNNGNTPTKNARMYVSCVVRDAPLPRGFQFEYPDAEVVPNFISARGGLQGGLAPALRPAITPDDITETQEGRRWIYLWGWMRYSDVFDGTSEHITHFCWQIMPVGFAREFVPNTTGTPPTPHTLAFPYLQHSEGNYAD